MRVLSLLKRLAVFCAASALSACGNPKLPFDQPVPRDIQILSSEVSPDGKTIVLAYRFRHGPGRLATISAVPGSSAAPVFLETPPGLAWDGPTWAPDGRHIAAVSFCRETDCYEGAADYNVWRLNADGSGMVRQSPIVAREVGQALYRARPVFGDGLDDVFYVEGGISYVEWGTLLAQAWDSAPRRLIRAQGGVEREVLPGAFEGMEFFRLVPTAGLTRDPRLIVASIAAGSRHPVVDSLGAPASANGFASALLGVSGDTLRLMKPTPVVDAYVPRSGAGYVYVSRHEVDGALRFRLHLVAQESDRVVLDYDRSRIWDPWVSGDLKQVYFSAHRDFARDQTDTAVWHLDAESGALTDLRLPERLRAALLARQGQPGDAQ